MIRFGGWANDQKIASYKQKLTEELAVAGLSHTDRYYLLGYNAPYEIFGRRNEMVELDKD